MAEQKKYILLEHLKKLALKERADYVNLIAQALGGELSPGITVTLPAANWDGNEQTVSDERLLADSHYWYLIGADADCFISFLDAGIMADNITVSGEITFKCTTVPKDDLTVNIIRLEVETGNE